MRRWLTGVLLACFACCAFAQAPAPKPTRLLFIGNSLVANSDLAARVVKVALATGRDARAVTQASAGFSLDDHWSDGKVRDLLARGWDIVVLQQDVPTGDQRAAFVLQVKRFAAAIREAGARPALFMSWPRADRPDAFRDAIAIHRDAAEAANATLIPAAEAWLRALGEDKRLKLYAGKGTDAGPLGNDLAVLTTYFTLFPAGAQEFDEAYIAKIAAAADLAPGSRDLLVDAATRAIDEPLALGKKRSP